MRAELAEWGLDAPQVDAGQTLLALLAQSAARVRRYGSLLAAAYDGTADFPEQFAGAGVASLIGFKHDLTKDGDPVAVEEAVRGLVGLEAAERDRCAKFAKLALDAGVGERLVRLAERQLDTLEAVLRLALERAGLDDAVRARVIEAVPLALGEIVRGGAT